MEVTTEWVLSQWRVWYDRYLMHCFPAEDNPNRRVDMLVQAFEIEGAWRCSFCGRLGKSAQLSCYTFPGLCENHRAGTPGGRRLSRMIEWTGVGYRFVDDIKELKYKIRGQINVAKAVESLFSYDNPDVNRDQVEFVSDGTWAFWFLLWDKKGEIALLESAARLLAWKTLEDRYRAGVKEARRKGGSEGGRPRIDGDRIDMARKEIQRGATLSVAAKRAGLSRTTLWRYLNRPGSTPM